MILTGPEIRKSIDDGSIQIDPYEPDLVGPNSIDLRLGEDLLVYEVGLKGHVGQDSYRHDNSPVLDMMKSNRTVPLKINEHGFVLYPGVLYLGTTIESIGTNCYVPIVEGRSSVGRLGIHIHVTAGFCDIGFKGKITLEIHVIHPVKVYPNKPICQAYFLKPVGEIDLYKGRYCDQAGPVPSRFWMGED